MISLNFISGDIFDSDADALVNPVNTVGVMGAGLAKQFATRFPAMVPDYQEHCRQAKQLHAQFGLHVSKCDNVWVVNLPTKEHFKSPSELSYIRRSLMHLRQWVISNNISSITLPALGTGLGKLSAIQVLHLITYHLKFIPHSCRIDLYGFENVPTWLKMYFNELELKHNQYPRFTSVGSRRTNDSAEERYCTALTTIYSIDPRMILCTGDAYKGGDKISWKHYAGKKFRFGPPNRDYYLPDTIVVPEDSSHYSRAVNIASSLHGGWKYMDEFQRSLHTRNVFQVLGASLNRPSEFLLCWTPDGAENTTGRDTGGTGTAIRIANQYGIPVFNLKNEDVFERLYAFLDLVY